MYLYKFDKETLNLRKIWVPSFYLIPIAIIIFAVLAFSNQDESKTKMVEYEKIPLIIDYSINSNFSPNELYAYLKELNVKCPKVVMCQAINETRFSSIVFRKNHNIFNMKAASSRPNMQIGYENDHAVFRNWKESAADYAMWQAFCITPAIKTDEQYFNFLVQSHYAESSSYIANLRNIYNNFDRTLATYQKMWETGKLNNPEVIEDIKKIDSLSNK